MILKFCNYIYQKQIIKLLLFIILPFIILLLLNQSLSAQSIALDSVLNNEMYSNYLKTNSEITFIFRVKGDNSSHKEMTNGFKVYSSDGAIWSTTVFDTTGSLADSQFDLIFKINSSGITGSNADSVGMYGMCLTSTGLPSNFDSQAFSIKIGPIPTESIGKTICLDTASFPLYPVWKWSYPEVIPEWGGPYCFMVCEGLDLDLDGIPYDCDNCPSVYNPEQEDWNQDGIGDSCIATDIYEDKSNDLPLSFTLSQNYPNPFNPYTTVLYSLPYRSDVLIEVININGQVIQTLVDEEVDAGTFEVVWDGTNTLGKQVSTGIYLYRLKTSNYTETKKMLFLK